MVVGGCGEVRLLGRRLQRGQRDGGQRMWRG